MANYRRRHHRKYLLQVHLVLVTKYRKQLLVGEIAEDTKQRIFELSLEHNWEIVAMETDKDHIHILLSYDAVESVCEIVKTIKQETTFYLWKRYRRILNKQYWLKEIFWSRGYFACSIGNVSAEVIHKYIDSQG